MQRFWIQPNIITFVLLGWFLTKCTLTLSEGKQSRVAVLTCFVLVLPFTAYWRNVERVDQSANDHFRQYALAVLDTLPRDSLLFVNYDQQWTSIRYLQECEGHRKDITSINLSMMTYGWWGSKRDLYDAIHFPGTHYTRGKSRQWFEGGFTFSGNDAVYSFPSPRPHTPRLISIGRTRRCQHRSFWREHLYWGPSQLR